MTRANATKMLLVTAALASQLLAGCTNTSSGGQLASSAPGSGTPFMGAADGDSPFGDGAAATTGLASALGGGGGRG